MAPAEHLTILFSIILGLGVTELLSSVHHLLHPRSRVKWHWLPLFWAALAFLAMVFWWWAMFEFTSAGAPPSFFAFVLILLAPVALYLVGTSALPDILPGEVTDLGVFYMENRYRFFGFLSVYTAVVWFQVLLFNWFDTAGQHVFVGVSLLLLLVLMRSRSLLIHAALTLSMAVLFVASVLLYWLRLM